ncbi:hypothetical protein PO148_03755 [Limosilactobacillus mucosae]|uniref:Uncharacterized protein n=1 Tax=Limosilactobacillus mucosae TaxID=97478 RepID=A0AAJ1MAB7_LIMMU|nr:MULTISPECIES: hypothetical protein [Lactobacillaceae]MDD6892976.1 hypothetical protein [Lactobacillus sp.]MDC2829540.1 hypothetical protein [Limosilactobacillus mucosae]MDC2836885.1 hypothetical protein [Limosilactobacillus mucosae]MDC2849105.1 hypothetical protein [Limosilactobacillus mucosae]MDC2853115.1 hypothetical protein [Limosilactobacillus mucosae]
MSAAIVWSSCAMAEAESLLELLIELAETDYDDSKMRSTVIFDRHCRQWTMWN